MMSIVNILYVSTIDKTIVSCFHYVFSYLWSNEIRGQSEVQWGKTWIWETKLGKNTRKSHENSRSSGAKSNKTAINPTNYLDCSFQDNELADYTMSCQNFQYHYQTQVGGIVVNWNETKVILSIFFQYRVETILEKFSKFEGL